MSASKQCFHSFYTETNTGLKNKTYQQLLLKNLAYLVNSTIEVQINKGEKPQLYKNKQNMIQLHILQIYHAITFVHIISHSSTLAPLNSSWPLTEKRCNWPKSVFSQNTALIVTRHKWSVKQLFINPFRYVLMCLSQFYLNINSSCLFPNLQYVLKTSNFLKIFIS